MKTDERIVIRCAMFDITKLINRIGEVRPTDDTYEILCGMHQELEAIHRRLDKAMNDASHEAKKIGKAEDWEVDHEPEV
jgi:hypothetical protein